MTVIRKWAKSPAAQCAALTICVLLFQLGMPAQLAIAAVLFAAMLLVDVTSALGMYVFMFFMDEMVVMPLLGGSISRVMQAALALRFAAYYIAKWRAQGMKAFQMLKRSDVLLTAFAILAVLLGLLDHGVSGETASFAVNAGLFILMRPIIRDLGASETLEALLRYFVRGALSSVVIGLALGRFVSVLFNEETQSYARFLGTSEPNFTAAFLGTAVHIHLSLERRRGRLIDAAITGVLGGAIILTYSMTGMLWFMLASVVLLLVHRAELKPLFARIGLALPIAAVCFALVSGYVMVRGVDSFERSMMEEKTYEEIYYIMPEDYERIRRGEAFEDVARRGGEIISEVERHTMSERNRQALANEAQSNALAIRIREALSRLQNGELDALTSGRYGLLRMKIGDYAALPTWQKLLGTGPDTALTYQPLAYRLNYCHNSYADALYSFGAVGFVLVMLYIFHLQRRRMFAGEQMSGSVARAIFMGRTSMLFGALALSMHISRVMLFFVMI